MGWDWNIGGRMPYKRRHPCGWDSGPDEPTLEELHDILNCAAKQGCRQCVECSETALDILVRRVEARNKNTPRDRGRLR